MSPRARERLLLSAAVALAVGLRARDVTTRPPLPDEAESAINALTILEHGVPTGRYLGLPIYENVLLEPWPEHPEYEFRDTSYSPGGLAIYHGWLPLYAMAGTYAALGVEPDAARDLAHEPPRPRRSVDAARLRAAAPRLQALAFSAVFLLAAFALGRAVAGPGAGRAAGWTALAVAALAPPCVEAGGLARYTSATLALSTLACLLLWRVWRRGAWGDHLAAGLVLGLLFHTHALVFAGACAAALPFAPAVWRREGGARRSLASVALVAALVVPWVLATGILSQLGRHPTARSLLRPGDLLAILAHHAELVLLVLAAAAVLALAARGPARWRAPAAELRPALLLLAAWVVVGYTTFLALVPAASCFSGRLTLGVLGPAIALGALLLVAGGRALRPGLERAAAPAVGAALAVAVAVPEVRALGTPADPRQEYAAFEQLAAHLEAEPPSAGARLYATPDLHLPLQLLLGLPAQSVAPVRREHLTSTPREVLLIDGARPRGGPKAAELVAAAAAVGAPLEVDAAARWERRLQTRLLREALSREAAAVDPPLAPLPAFAERALEPHRAPRAPRGDGLWWNPAVFRGHEAFGRTAFWQTFFYRFVDPQARSGPAANYAERLRSARAVVLPCAWVVFRCPPLKEASSHD